MQSILILNGSPSGRKGNCQKLILKIKRAFSKSIKSEVVHLAELKSFKSVFKSVEKSQGIIFVTGTYWDSWGSPLQKFLEQGTDLEGTPALMGKPCAVVVLKHSVGGKGVLSRLQGVLSTMGLLVPPMSGMVYSLVSDISMKAPKTLHQDDLWSLEDLKVVLKNFEIALELGVSWQTWPVDRKNFRKTWVK